MSQSPPMTTRDDDDLVRRLRRDRIVDARLGYTCNATALELEAATALEAANAEIARLKAAHFEADDKRCHWQNKAEELQRQLAAETSPEATPLIWNEYEREGDIDEWDAETAFGTFYSVQRTAFNFMPYYDRDQIQNEGKETPEEAKLVCQADYSRRIAAAIRGGAKPPEDSFELQAKQADEVRALRAALAQHKEK